MKLLAGYINNEFYILPDTEQNKELFSVVLTIENLLPVEEPGFKPEFTLINANTFLKAAEQFKTSVDWGEVSFYSDLRRWANLLITDYHKQYSKKVMA